MIEKSEAVVQSFLRRGFAGMDVFREEQVCSPLWKACPPLLGFLMLYIRKAILYLLLIICKHLIEDSG